MAKKPVKIMFGKQAISIRLDTVVLDFFRKSGPRWQSRVNEILRKYVEKQKNG